MKIASYLANDLETLQMYVLKSNYIWLELKHWFQEAYN